MKCFKYFSSPLALMLAMTFFSTSCMAKVFVCIDEECDNYAKITDIQNNKLPTGENKPTVQAALNESADSRIKSGVSSDDLNLYLKSNLWHKGGSGGTDIEHLTAFVYRKGEHKTTCHIMSKRKELSGPYITTCTP